MSSTTAYFPVPVEEMSPLLTYLLPLTNEMVTTKDKIPSHITHVHLPYDLPEGHAVASTQKEAIEMCDVA